MTAPLHTVHVRINDAATGEATPVRVRFVDSQGNYLTPLGRPVSFPTGINEDVNGNVLLGEKRYTYIDGGCEIRLPADPVTIEVTKGPEYRPIRQQLTLGTGKMAVRLAIERWIDLRQERWYSGDVRCHFLTPHAALLEGAAENLAVVNLLAMELPLPARGTEPVKIIPNILAFSGQRPILEMPGHVVVVNTLNSHPRLGQLALLNCHRTVYPLTFGGQEGLEDWSLADWCDQCHRKNGLVVWSEDFHHALHGEALADLVLGKVDALDGGEVDAKSLALGAWYNLLNCGCRVPLTAGSWKHSNRNLLGGVRTYARLKEGEAFTYGNWIEAIRAGRTFVTNGPLLTLTVNGHDPGAMIDLPADKPVVQVRAEARSLVPFDRLEIVCNGMAVAGVEPSGKPCTALLEAELPVAGSGWLAARCWGEEEASPDRKGRVAAHSSAVHVQVAGQPAPVDASALAVLVQHLDETLHWLQHNGRYENDHQRQHLVGIFESARGELVRRGSAGDR